MLRETKLFGVYALRLHETEACRDDSLEEVVSITNGEIYPSTLRANIWLLD
jgi:hypothetical protein